MGLFGAIGGAIKKVGGGATRAIGGAVKGTGRGVGKVLGRGGKPSAPASPSVGMGGASMPGGRMRAFGGNARPMGR